MEAWCACSHTSLLDTRGQREGRLPSLSLALKGLFAVSRPTLEESKGLVVGPQKSFIRNTALSSDPVQDKIPGGPSPPFCLVLYDLCHILIPEVSDLVSLSHIMPMCSPGMVMSWSCHVTSAVSSWVSHVCSRSWSCHGLVKVVPAP